MRPTEVEGDHKEYWFKRLDQLNEHFVKRSRNDIVRMAFMRQLKDLAKEAALHDIDGDDFNKIVNEWFEDRARNLQAASR